MKERVVMVVRVHGGNQSDLLEIINALGAAALFLGLTQRGQEHARENGYDCDDH
jgi:hypothetical protein